jgi:dethiobiotin synthetase
LFSDSPVHHNRFLITGTDTSVGKTTVTAGLAAALTTRSIRVGVLKPVETGCTGAGGRRLVAADARRLAFFARCQADEDTICPYRFREPLAPQVAAERAGQTIALERIVSACERLAADNDVVFIEGAGGLLVPLHQRATFAELCTYLGAALLVVVGNRLGAINHALLTVRYAQMSGLPVVGYFLNTLAANPDAAAATNAAVLRQLLGEPLGVIPWLGEVSETDAERARLARLFSERTDFARWLR